jgi:hypothetical protein
VWSEVTLELERAQPFHNTPSNQNEPGTQVLLPPSVAQKIFNLLRQAEKYIELAHSPIQYSSSFLLQMFLILRSSKFFERFISFILCCFPGDFFL